MNDIYLKVENILFTATVVFYLLSSISFIIYAVTKKEKISKWASLLIHLGFICHTIAIVARGIGAKRVPLSNQYEFATGFSWGIALFYLIFQRKHETKVVGAFIAPLALLLIGYAAMQNRTVRPLMPALQSGWLAVHVSLAILSYGAFALSFGLSIMYLVKYKHRDRLVDAPGLDKIDKMSYNAIAIGFLFLTLTIITGALWAQKAWGRYWAWDPKETWSLITWFIYTVYLHLRRTKKTDQRASAWFAVIGFIAVVFTYIGVNNLLPSLHTYV